MPIGQTLAELMVDYFTERPEEIDEFVSNAYINYVENGETAVIQSILSSVAPAKGVASISISEAALISEIVLAKDWNRTEEDEAWLHLQHGQPSSNSRSSTEIGCSFRKDYVLNFNFQSSSLT